MSFNHGILLQMDSKVGIVENKNLILSYSSKIFLHKI